MNTSENKLKACYYSKVLPPQIRYSLSLTPLAKLIYAELQLSTNRPSCKELALRFGKSKRTIQASLRQLADNNLIEYGVRL